LLRGAGKEVGCLRDDASDEIGDATSRIRDGAAFFQHDDRPVGIGAFRLGGSAHARRIATDDEEALWHLISLLPKATLSTVHEYVRKVFLHAWKEAINKPLPRPTT
jgi:hypothetical protein